MRHSWLYVAAALVLGTALLVGQSWLFAAENAAGVIKYRQSVMRSHWGHLGGMFEILKNGLPYKGHIAGHARAVSESSKIIADIFPEGTADGKTDAKAVIWQEWDDFKAKARNMGKEAAKLEKIARSGSMADIGAQMKKVGKACGSCHKKFRKPKEESYKRK